MNRMHTTTTLPRTRTALTLPVLLLSLFNTGLHLFCHHHLEYHRDELLYFALGNHPDWGYETVPPLIGILAFGLHSLFGYSLLAVRIFPALLSGVLIWLGAAIARELGGGRYAVLLTGVGLMVAPLMLRAFSLYQPVFLDIFFWTLCFYWLIRYLNTQSARLLIFLGITAGFALLNKYLIALLLLAMGFCLFFSPHKTVFRRKELYWSAGLALLILLPNLIWQVTHRFPVIGHMRGLNDVQLVHVSRSVFLLEQLLMPLMASLLVVPGVYWLLRQRTYRVIGWTALLVVIVLCLLRGKNYYTAGIFPVLIAAGGVYWERTLRSRVWKTVLPCLMVLLTLPVLPMGIPVFGPQGLIRYFAMLEQRFGLQVGRQFEDGTVHALPQDYADMLGWEELTSVVNQAYRQAEDPRKTIIFCENYGQAGAVAVIGRKYGLPEPLSFHESFKYWLPRRFEPEVEELIYVNDELGEDVQAAFADIREVGKIRNPYAREAGTTVYSCRKPRQPFNQLWSKALRRIE